MNDKYVAKKYLIMASVLFVGAFVITLALMLGLKAGDKLKFDLSFLQMLGISLVCAYLPCASFTGFCICFIPIKELTHKNSILLVALFPIWLVLITLAGIVMLIPTYVKEIIVISKNEVD